MNVNGLKHFKEDLLACLGTLLYIVFYSFLREVAFKYEAYSIKV